MERYDAAILEHDIENDSAQRVVIERLQRLADELASSRPLWVKLGFKKAVQGLYIYGPVGVGKTFLMDMFYDYVAKQHKARFHFHQFMQQVDEQLRRLQGQKDPLRRIAAHLAKTTRLLCFDEFLVYDVADAMILSELLQAILAKGVVLVATSNTPPDELYAKGVQRDRFLPAISLIKQHCQVLALKDQRDYRLGRLSLSQAYLTPLNKASEQLLNQQFISMTKKMKTGMDLSIQNRRIPCVKLGDRVVWFAFDVICNLPRSQLDYLEIAERFDTVFVSDIPVLTSNDTVRVILLIHFIDVMYDKGIRLIVSAAVEAGKLYTEGEKLTAFQRTLSRIEEMQSEDYLRRHQRRQRHLLSGG
jgi:cell division protein ZapE